MSVSLDTHSYKQRHLSPASGARAAFPERMIPEGIDRSSSSPLERSTAKVLHDFSGHHYGHTYSTINKANGPGPAYFINHIENASFGLNADLLLVDGVLPKQPDIVGAREEYLTNSRADDERVIWEWVDDPSGELVLCVHGAAGLGKSTLARHVQQQLRSRDRLAAAVYLNALQADFRSPESVTRLIAGELGRIHTEACPAIAEAIHQCHGLPLQTQLEKFILNPLRALQLRFPLIVLLDAIDEWMSHQVFLEALSCLNPHFSLVRFVIFGRSELRGKECKPLALNLKRHLLQPVSNHVMVDYLNRRFAGVEWEQGTEPTSYDVMRLADKANGLFIWTATACSLLEDGLSPSSPRDTLAAIMHSRRSIGETHDMAQLYYDAIILLFPKQEQQDVARIVLGAMIALQEPLPPAAFSSLIGMRESVIEKVQASLRILQVRRPLDKQPMIHPADALFHLSFIEFLQSPSTPPTLTFSITIFDSHTRLASASLQELVRFLPAAQDPGTLQLSPFRQYIVNYWPLHLCNGSPSVEPGSYSEWQATTLYSILRDMPIETLYHWAALIFRIAKVGSTALKPSYTNDEKGALMLNVARSLAVHKASLSRLRISCLAVAVRLRPDDERAWSALGEAYELLMVTSASNAGFSQAVAARRNALRLGESESLRQPYLLCALGHALHENFHNLGQLEDLEESVSLHRSAVSSLSRLPSFQSPLAVNYLTSLAAALDCRFKARGSKDDLWESMELAKKAIELRTPNGPRPLAALWKYGASLQLRYQITGLLDDLQEAVAIQREAVTLSPPGHPSRCDSLGRLGSYLYNLFVATGGVDDIQEAISLHREALTLCPSDSPIRSQTLSHLALCLAFRFEAFSDPRDLSESISLAHELCSLAMDGKRAWYLNVSAFALQFQAEHLDKALSLAREGVSLLSSSNVFWRFIAYTLSLVLYRRYQLTGSVEELEESLSRCREALALCPPGDWLYRRLVDLEAKMVALAPSVHTAS